MLLESPGCKHCGTDGCTKHKGRKLVIGTKGQERRPVSELTLWTCANQAQDPHCPELCTRSHVITLSATSTSRTASAATTPSTPIPQAVTWTCTLCEPAKEEAARCLALRLATAQAPASALPPESASSQPYPLLPLPTFCPPLPAVNATATTSAVASSMRGWRRRLLPSRRSLLSSWRVTIGSSHLDQSLPKTSAGAGVGVLAVPGGATGRGSVRVLWQRPLWGYLDLLVKPSSFGWVLALGIPPVGGFTSSISRCSAPAADSVATRGAYWW